MPSESKRKISFPAFFLIWAKIQRWTVPWFHILICDWLTDWSNGRVKVLKVFRGAAKSTSVALWEAFEIYDDPAHRFLVQSATDGDALKMTRDCRNVLTRHPLCVGILPPGRPSAEKRINAWANPDARNANVIAAGVMSQVTGSRSDTTVFDDIEVPKNIRTPEARLKLRNQISEATHILVPGGRKLYIGTPHTHDSIYEELEEQGADVLTLKLFSHHVRYEDLKTNRFRIPFQPGPDGLYVFLGPKLLEEGKDYLVDGHHVVFPQRIGGLVDIYAGCIWPERFTREDIAFRRKECKTTNEWDAQYQLEAKPIHHIRLNPDKLIPYDIEPTIRHANGSVSMWLGKVRIVGARLYWDPSAGKVHSDDSVLALVLTDDRGNLYWHRSIELTGDVFTDIPEQKHATQCYQVREVVIKYQIPTVFLETNGGFSVIAPLLRRELAGTGAGVREIDRKQNKTTYILDAIEGPLSGQFLWTHISLWETKLINQMRDWIPGVENQADDHIDAGAGAITQTPIRIGKIIGNVTAMPVDRWQPNSGVHEVTVET